MPRKKPSRNLRIALFMALVGLLAMVRLFENQLFYDPLLAYFKSEFNGRPLPDFNVLQLAVSLCLRYGLNTLISLAILYVVFWQKELVQFSALLYGLFFVLLMVAFFVIVYGFGARYNLELFYVRRFLIQPIFVVLFLPAFYFQEKVAKK